MQDIYSSLLTTNEEQYMGSNHAQFHNNLQYTFIHVRKSIVDVGSLWTKGQLQAVLCTS